MTYTRHIALILLAVLFWLTDTCQANGLLHSLPKQSPVSNGYESADSIVRRLSANPIDDAEGLWRIAGDGALIAIERFNSTDLPDSHITLYSLTMVDAPQRHPRPGTLIGYMTPTARRGSFDAVIYSELNDAVKLERPKKFVIALNGDGHMSITPVKSGLKVNLWRLVPYLFRFSVSVGSNRPAGLDGAIRVWPEPDPPTSPRYL